MKIVDLYGMSEEERKKALQEQQSMYNERMQQSDEIRKQANQQFNDLISKNGQYNTAKHTTTVGALEKAYKDSSAYNKVHNSLRRMDLSREDSIWNRIKNIASSNANNYNNQNSYISRNDNGMVNRTATAINMANQNNRNANMILKTQLYNNAYKEALPIREEKQNIQKNKNLLEDAKSLSNLYGLGVSTGNKAVLNFIESSNGNIFDEYNNLRKKQSLTSPKVNEIDKSALKMQEDLPLLKSKGINIETENKIETNLIKKAIRDSINKDNQKIQEEQQKIDNKLMGNLGEIAPSMGQQLPGAILNAVNPVLGTAYFYASAGGNYIEDGLQRGMTEEQAWQYGNIMGALEGVSEAFITGQQMNKLSKAFAGKEISSSVLNSYGFNIFENAVQEAVMEPAQEITAGIVGDKADWSNIGERMAKSGFNGALMGAISNGVTAGLEKSGKIYNKVKNGESVSQSEYKEALQENIDKFGKEAVENAMKNGAKEVYQEINSKNINEVREVLKQLPIENATANLQQQSTQNEQNIPTQQITQEQNKVAQNGNMEQIMSTQNENRKIAIDEINNSRISTQEKQQMIEALNNIEEVSNEDIYAIRNVINEANKINQLPTDLNYKDNREARQKYAKYKNDNSNYDSTIVNEVLDTIPTNRNGRRTVKQWLQVANEMGTRIADKSDAEIEKIAYRSWFEEQPTKNITRYDNQAKTNVGFQKLTSDEWLNTINNAVNEARTNNQAQSNNVANNQETFNLPVKENNTQNAPTKGETIDLGENEIKESEKISDEGIAKILTEPNKPNDEKRKLRAFLKANIIDKGMVFEELSRKTGNRELQSKYDYTLTSEARGQNAIGNARYNYETEIDKNGKVKKGNKEGKQLCKSLTDIIDEVGNNQEDFYNYMYHQLNIDRMTLEDRFDGDTGTNYERKKAIKNKPVFGKGVTAELSQNYVQELEQRHPEFKEYAQDVYDFLDANMQELVKNGVISQETSDLFKEMYPHYVPISRITNKGSAINVPLDTKRTGINTPIKKATGGNRDIQPLFQTMADRTLQTYRASARNSFGVELKNTLLTANKLNQNLGTTDIDNILDSMADENKNKELLQKGENGNNPTFTVFENGNKVTYEISNDMYDALKPKNELFKRIDESKLSKGLSKFNSFRRGLLTEYNPIFSITNAIKDAQDVLLNSQHATKTYSKIPEATAQILGKGYWYKEYIQNGGEQNSYFRDGEFEAKKTNLPSKIKDKVTLPLRAISNVNNVIEMTPRLAEYIASRENGASIETAMLDASRVTTNFKAGGDFTKTLNRNGFTFLNASVQGMQQQIRNVQEANAKGLKGYATLATKYAISALPVLFLNNVIWDDDDDYKNLQDYVKDNYYIIGKIDNGTFVRIPKGRAVATIQKIVSNANDFIKETTKGNTIDIDKLGSTFWNDLKEDLDFAKDNLAPNNPFDNNVIAPITQVLQNKTWYGEDLVPTRLKDKPKEEQYDETTDWLSKWIGEQLKISPMKINYLLDQYSGGVGDVILPMMTPQAENNVIEDKFTTNPVMKNKYPGKFFEKVDELKVANNSEKASDLDKVKYKYATDLQGEISDLYKEKREIQNSSKEDKIKKIELEKVQKEINELTEKGLNKLEEIKINGDISSIDGTNYYKLDGEWKKVKDDDNERLKGISLKTYADFKNKIKKETDTKKDSGELDENQQLKDKDKISLLKNSNYSDKEKKEIYSNFINSKDDTLSILNKMANVNINAYLDYKLQKFKDDEDTNSNIVGKTISGSKKEKIKQYLKNSNLSNIERAYLFGKSYKLDGEDKNVLKQYMEKLSNTDKIKVCKDLTLNFEQRKDGKYYWK